MNGASTTRRRPRACRASEGRLLKSFDFDERGNDIPPTPSLCGPNAPSLHSAYCEGAYLFVDEPRDGATYQPTLQRGTFSPSLRIRNADGSSRDFMDVLRDDLDLNATIATSVDLYTWSISRYPRDAELAGLWVFEDGGGDPFVVCRDSGRERPAARGAARATFRCELQGAEGKAASDAFPDARDGNAAKTWYLQRPWQLPGRAEVLRRNGYHEEARASEALFLALGEWTGQSELQPFRDFTAQEPPSGNRYVSFRSPPNGLSNQRRDIATMVFIANVSSEEVRAALPLHVRRGRLEDALFGLWGDLRRGLLYCNAIVVGRKCGARNHYEKSLHRGA